MAANPGAVQTRDGKRRQGDLSFTNDAVQVSNQVEVASIARADIARLSFDPEALPPSEPASSGAGLGLLGLYFAKTNVHGPVQVRLDPAIAFDWGVDEPLDGLGRDYFAIVWMGYLEAPASGEFTFTLTADDRARLQVGPDLLIETSRREQKEEASGKLAIEKGQRYPVTLLYQDLLGPARIRLAWSGPDVPESVIPAGRLYPASFVAEHQANIESSRGLLATTYEKADFSGHTSSRVDPEPYSATNLTRWTGRLRADHTEPYTFYIAAEGPVRIRVDGKPLIDKWSNSAPSELKATCRLTAGEQYDLEVDAAAPARLLWSSPSQPKCVIPQTHLLPFRKPQQVLSPTGPNPSLPAGVLLRNGSFVACRVEAIKEDTVRCSQLLEGKQIALSDVARIVFRPLPRSTAARMTAGRPGVLLANGDFIEGEFNKVEGTRLTISSVLLGLRTYDTTQQVLAVIIRETEAATGRWEVQLRDQSVLFANDLQLLPGAVVLNDRLFAGGIRVTERDIRELRVR